MHPKYLVCLAALWLLTTQTAQAYDRSAALQYAELYWNAPNHDCGTSYSACTPWSYWGMEACGYPTHGGDCANFVSQCLLAGGESDLDNEPNGICRGFPCGREEIGAEKLSQCLVTYHGWKEVGSGDMAPPPASIIPGDVLVYCNAAKQGSHTVLVVSAGAGKATIACHSTAHYDMLYSYMTDTDHRWYRWLHNPAAVAVRETKIPSPENGVFLRAPRSMHIAGARLLLPAANDRGITFSIVDVRGGLVRKFQRADLQGGELVWDGRDGRGAQASGMTYFVVAASGTKVIAVRKIMAIR